MGQDQRAEPAGADRKATARAERGEAHVCGTAGGGDRAAVQHAGLDLHNNQRPPASHSCWHMVAERCGGHKWPRLTGAQTRAVEQPLPALSSVQL